MIGKLTFLAALALSTSLTFAETRVEIEINDSATELDDFLCWSPTQARARVITSDAGSLPVIISSKTEGTGSVVFAAQNGSVPSRSNVNASPTLNISLAPDGSWTQFYVLGAAASAGDKDVSIVAKDASGSTLGSKLVMVRVRKDAETLTPIERDQFLSALEQFHGHHRAVGHGEEYVKYATIHDSAFNLGIHRADQGFPLFLAWHRAFLISLERELQAIDPRVSLPYWRFDRDTTKLFTEEFLGRVSGPQAPGGVVVKFSNTNPIRGWSTIDDGQLRRVDNGDMAVTKFTWDGSQEPMVRELEVIFASSGASVYAGSQPRRGINARMESTYHNGAHARIDGWLGSGSSPRDPLFFLLHANVDRAWAEWQEKNSRFDKTSIDSYSLQGAYPGGGDPNRWIKSSYLNDGMWPWSLDNGTTTPVDNGDDWPSKGFAFPTSPVGFNPNGPPTPADMIDYMNELGESTQLGMCYDHLGFFGAR
jgi:tyrosinase